jgi:hypothetical protein
MGMARAVSPAMQAARPKCAMPTGCVVGHLRRSRRPGCWPTPAATRPAPSWRSIPCLRWAQPRGSAGAGAAQHGSGAKSQSGSSTLSSATLRRPQSKFILPDDIIIDAKSGEAAGGRNTLLRMPVRWRRLWRRRAAVWRRSVGRRVMRGWRAHTCGGGSHAPSPEPTGSGAMPGRLGGQACREPAARPRRPTCTARSPRASTPTPWARTATCPRSSRCRGWLGLSRRVDEGRRVREAHWCGDARRA